MLIVFYPNMHVTGMEHVDRRRGDNEAMHASVRRERRECWQQAEAKGVVQAPRRRAGRPHRAIADNEPQPQAEPEYDQMDVEYNTPFSQHRK